MDFKGSEINICLMISAKYIFLDMSKKILVIFAHPALEKSRVHKEFIKGLDTIENVTFHDLYEVYPNFDIDVNREKEILTQHDILVFQHPMFWYSVPALIKRMD